MFDGCGQFQASSIAPSGRSGRYDPGVWAVGKAVSVFHTLHWRAQLRRLLGNLLGRPHELLDLDDVRRTETVEAVHETGVVTVEVSKIRGSECRVCDFDDQFLPLRNSNEQRWAAVYAARLCGEPLPAVSLVQVGDTYFVRDGHHRVSVARVMGEEYIEANLQVWQLKGQVAPAPAMSPQLLAMYR